MKKNDEIVEDDRENRSNGTVDLVSMKAKNGANMVKTLRSQDPEPRVTIERADQG